MKKKVTLLLCALTMVLAMSMTAMAAPSPEFPDTDFLYEDPTEPQTTIDTPSVKEPTTEPVTKPVKEPITEHPNNPGDDDDSGYGVKGFPETEYLYENPNTAETTSKSDTSPKTGEGMGIIFAVIAAIAFAGTAYAAKKHLSTEE